VGKGKGRRQRLREVVRPKEIDLVQLSAFADGKEEPELLFNRKRRTFEKSEASFTRMTDSRSSVVFTE